MAHTLTDIIHRAVILAQSNGARLGLVSRDGINLLESTGGGVLTLSDTAALPPGGSSTHSMRNWWIWLPEQAAADQRRIVESYAASSATLTHSGPQWSGTAVTALGAGEPYMLLKDDPDKWTSAAYEALRSRLSTVEFGLLTLVADQVTYQVTETSVTRQTQIVAVDWAPVDDDPGEERWQPWNDGYHAWRTYSEGDVVVIDFIDPNRLPKAASHKIRVKYTRQFAVGDSPWDVDLDWAAWATLTVMSDRMRDPDNPSDDWNVLSRQAAETADGYRRRFLATDGYTTVKRPQIRTGIVGVRGRM